MNINIDNSTNIMRWEHENISYEYIIDSTGRAFAYISGDYIFIEIYNEGCSFHRVISVKGENIIWYSDLGEVNISLIRWLLCIFQVSEIYAWHRLAIMF